MKKRNAKKSFVLVLVALVMALVLVNTVLAAKPDEAPVYWTWDVGGTPVGSSKLVRTDSGISASYETEGMTPGNAVTLWFIVFNNPELCSDGECGPDDLGDTDAQGDFFLAGGHVIGDDGKGDFGGHLSAGDTSRSGLAEVLACEECTPGLIDPEGALVILATHDHGPAQTGQTLKEQISSFLGGCELPFLGNPDGFATGPGDLPQNAGECSTIQFSPHPPN